MPTLYFFSSESFGQSIRELAATRSISAFDSLAAGSPDQDENDARFAAGLNVLKQVATETGCGCGGRATGRVHRTSEDTVARVAGAPAIQ